MAALVPPVRVAADVGTGDALLACHLVRAGGVERVIATDVGAGPLDQARATVARAGLADRVELRRGDGLLALRPGEAEVAVLAGMGARSMLAALAAAPDVLAGLRRLVLQPNGDPGPVRRWLLARGWRIAEEELVRERRHFYQVMAAELGREPPPPPELLAAGLEVGPRLWERRHPLLRDYLAHRVSVLARAVAAATVAPPGRAAGAAEGRSASAERLAGTALDPERRLAALRALMALLGEPTPGSCGPPI